MCFDTSQSAQSHGAASPPSPPSPSSPKYPPHPYPCLGRGGSKKIHPGKILNHAESFQKVFKYFGRCDNFTRIFDVLRMSNRIHCRLKWYDVTKTANIIQNAIVCAFMSPKQFTHTFFVTKTIYPHIFVAKTTKHTFFCENDLCALFCLKNNQCIHFLSRKRFTQFCCRKNNFSQVWAIKKL